MAPPNPKTCSPNAEVREIVCEIACRIVCPNFPLESQDANPVRQRVYELSWNLESEEYLVWNCAVVPKSTQECFQVLFTYGTENS